MNGEMLFQQTEYFRPFPNPADVFSSRVQEHCEYLLPLATLDLAHVSPEWSGPIHFVMPMEPFDGMVGQDTSEFHTYLCRENWIGYHIVDGRCELACDFRFFDKRSLEARSHYEAMRAAFELRAAHFREHGYLHHCYARKNASGHYDPDDRVYLVAELRGVSLDGNWSDPREFPMSTGTIFIDGEERQRASPLTEDGREFEYIGCLAMYHFIHETPDHMIFGGDLLLFYDPQESVALTTFDWS